jgi:PAS domain S-box-containing protein
MTSAHNTIPQRALDADELSDTLSFVPASGVTAALIRCIDWSKTALGPVAGWPQSLRTSVSICLNSRFPMLIWWGPQLVKIYNDAYVPMLGAKHPRALGQAGKDVWPEIWQIIGPMLEGVMARGEATWSEDTMLPLDRKGFIEECYFTFSYSPINVESGEIGGVFTAVSETTGKVIGERRLRTLRELANLGSRARTAREAAALAAAVLDTNLKDLPFSLIYLMRPDGALDLEGFAGFPPLQCHAPQQLSLEGEESPLLRQLREALDSGQLVEIEQPAALTGTPSQAVALRIAGAQDDRVGLLIVGISAHLSLDDQYRSFLGLVAGQLGAAISTATAYEAERRRAEALAEIDRAKTAFFSNVSHEFRTPIALMLGPLEEHLGDTQSDPARNRERVEIAYRNALRLQKLVNTLLEFSRIEAGRVAASFRATDLPKLTAELASVFRASIEKAGLRYSVMTAPLSESTYIDRDMWEKIVLNLLSNAFKFTFAGEIGIELSESAGCAVLKVRDTGTGIPAAELPNLFQRFHRVAGTVGRTQEGSGIGLALIQELVRLHGGTITVASELGQGSTFEVRIPLGRRHLPAECIVEDDSRSSTGGYAMASVAEAERWSAGPAEPLSADGQRPLILLADDNADMRAYIRSLLSDSWDVVAVSNGEEALAAAADRPPDLVLSDVMMPKLDGFGLIARLRQDERTRNVPVLLLSARAGEESRVEGLRAGAADYLVKPFSAKELLARIQTHLQIGRFKAAAERERAKLSAAFSQAPVGIALLEGPEHVFAIANPVYCDLLFGGPRDFLGKPVRDAIPESVSQGFVALLDQVYRSGEPFVGTEVPIDLVQHDGSRRRFYLSFVYQPLRDSAETIYGIVAVIHDVTDRVQDRLSLEDSKRQLERAVNDLEQERDLRDQLVATLSHDLRTPLQAGKMCAHILRRKIADNELVQSFAGRIIDNIGRADEMIRNLLDANRLKAGERLALEIELCELNEIVADALADLSTLHGDRFVLQAGSTIIGYWSRSELRRVLENLCVNAIKYGAPHRPVRVSLSQSNEHVWIEVHNEGEPIAAADRDRLFKPFKRIEDGGAAGRPAGWGLGLTLVKGIVEAHGGGVTLQSEAGTGTVFLVTLPRDSRGIELPAKEVPE